jgi:hypothetical protein
MMPPSVKGGIFTNALDLDIEPVEGLINTFQGDFIYYNL